MAVGQASVECRCIIVVDASLLVPIMQTAELKKQYNGSSAA